VNSIVRCPRTGRACSEGACRERHWCRQLFERGLSHRGLPLKRKFRPRCCAKTRAGAPCIMRVIPGKRRCRFHGGLSTGPRIAERQSADCRGATMAAESVPRREADVLSLAWKKQNPVDGQEIKCKRRVGALTVHWNPAHPSKRARGLPCYP
jgi:hypothetical protein